MNRNRCLATIVVAAAALLLAHCVHALINPRFTPIQLVKQSTLIVWVDVKPGESKDLYTATIRETLKGKSEQKTYRMDISQARDEEAVAALRGLVAEGKPALFFVGEFENTRDLGGGNTRRRAFMHIGGTWAVFDGGQDGLWVFRTLTTACSRPSGRAARTCCAGPWITF